MSEISGSDAGSERTPNPAVSAPNPTSAPPFPAELLAFVTSQPWTFAKTMPEWPHEYLVRDRVDAALFERLVMHIRTHGREGHFYARVLTYYEEAGLVYWTMGAPLSETTIINRCRREDTYEERLRRGTLPRSGTRAGPPTVT